MLIASFVGLEKTLEIYHEAIKENIDFTLMAMVC